MNIFGWGGQSKEELKQIIINNENLITQLRDEKVSAQISENRAQTGFNAQQESDRGAYEIEMARLKHTISLLEDGKKAAVESEVKRHKDVLTKEFADNKVTFRKELRAEFTENDASNKKTIKDLIEKHATANGNYNGALLVIKSLEKQLEAANKLSLTLISAMPEVKANVGSSAQTVTVNK